MIRPARSVVRTDASAASFVAGSPSRPRAAGGQPLEAISAMTASPALSVAGLLARAARTSAAR